MQQPVQNNTKCKILSRSEHPISRRNISREALKVLYRLHRSGFKSFLVGGGVRDLYLGRTPKDFDVVTDARLNKIRKLFRNSRLIGRRFKLVHVFFNNNKTIEVTTFRRSAEFAQKQKDGQILRDNTFGSEEEDARRRDLTVNGLFYDISNFSIRDYVGGIKDLEERRIRTIIDPNQSFTEDPVRMIRALRHAARLGFTIEKNTYQAILDKKHLIENINYSRLTEEIYRDLRGGASEAFFKLLHETGLLTFLFPRLSEQLDTTPGHILWKRLAALDRSILQGREYENPLLLCMLSQTVLLPPDFSFEEDSEDKTPDIGHHIYTQLKEMRLHFHMPLQTRNRISQIVLAVRRLKHHPADKPVPKSLLEKTYFPEALDFFELIEKAEHHSAAHLNELKQRSEQCIREKKKKRKKKTAGTPAGEKGKKTGATRKRKRPRKPRNRKRKPR